MVDDSAIGRRFIPVHANVEPGRLRYFLNALGERNPIYRDLEAAKAAGYAAIPNPADLSLLPRNDGRREAV